MRDMNSASQLRNCASDVVDAARRFEAAAQAPESYPGAPDSLAALEEAFQLLSAAWYRLAADASPDMAERRRRSSADGARPRADGLSREQEVRVLATLHDVAAAFARTARTCRSGRTKVAPIIERRLAATGASKQQADDTRWRMRQHEQPGRHVA
jgi:hypothetical protein